MSQLAPPPYCHKTGLTKPLGTMNTHLVGVILTMFERRRTPFDEPTLPSRP